MDEKRSSTSQITTFIFDLDGTLVETETLKADAYATIVGRLNGAKSPDRRAIDLYERIVGSTDEMVCRQMIEEFKLHDTLNPVEDELWKDLHRLRMKEYRAYHGTPKNLRRNTYNHNIELMKSQKILGRQIAVATSSFCDEAKRVLNALGVAELLDDVIGREMVNFPKPDPEIYRLTMQRLGVEPENVIIVEDSPIGVRSAIASGAFWICVSTPFSRSAINATPSINPKWVINDPKILPTTVNRLIESAENI